MGLTAQRWQGGRAGLSGVVRQHRALIGAEVAARFGEFADGYKMTVYGGPLPRLVKMGSALGVTVGWYSFFEGLELASGH